MSQEDESGCGVPIKKVVLVSCLTDDWFVLLASPLWAGRRSLGEIKEDSLMHINVIICLWRISIGTFCFKCCMSLCFISMCVVKEPLPPLREPYLAQLIATRCNLCLSRLSHFRRAALLPCFAPLLRPERVLRPPSLRSAGRKARRKSQSLSLVQSLHLTFGPCVWVLQPFTQRASAEHFVQVCAWSGWEAGGAEALVSPSR